MYIESIKIVDSTAQNIEYHQRRMAQVSSVTLPMLTPPAHLALGVVKCRVIYDRNRIINIEYHAYAIANIRTARLVESPIEYPHKFEDRSSLSTLYSLRGECDDIVITTNSYIRDSYFCNLVFETPSKELYTPDTPLLKGTKRQLLLDRGIIEERSITTSDLGLYSRCLLINAMIELEDRLEVRICE